MGNWCTSARSDKNTYTVAYLGASITIQQGSYKDLSVLALANVSTDPLKSQLYVYATAEPVEPVQQQKEQVQEKTEVKPQVEEPKKEDDKTTPPTEVKQQETQKVEPAKIEDVKVEELKEQVVEVQLEANKVHQTQLKATAFKSTVVVLNYRLEKEIEYNQVFTVLNEILAHANQEGLHSVGVPDSLYANVNLDGKKWSEVLAQLFNNVKEFLQANSDNLKITDIKFSVENQTIFNEFKTQLELHKLEQDKAVELAKKAEEEAANLAKQSQDEKKEEVKEQNEEVAVKKSDETEQKQVVQENKEVVHEKQEVVVQHEAAVEKK